MAFFKLLAGLHECNDPDWVRANPNPPEGVTCPSRIFKAGELVESAKDLVAQFGHEKFLYVGETRPGRRRPAESVPPQAIPVSTPSGPTTPTTVSTAPDSTTPPSTPLATEPVSTPDEVQEPEEPPMTAAEYHQMLDRMNLQQLRDHAAEEEVDLKGATTRAEILKRLKGR